ncbi:MAG: hypothetical protein ACUVRP_12070 [Chlorobiales bacterium]
MQHTDNEEFTTDALLQQDVSLLFVLQVLLFNQISVHLIFY